MTTFHEPWHVRPYDLKHGAQLVGANDSDEPWISQEWNLEGADGTNTLATVKFCTATGGWGNITSRIEAIAIRDRIIACVNACAGMADPVAEIARLRALESPGIVSEENSERVVLEPH